MTENVLDKGALRKLLDVIGGDPEDFDELKEEFLESVPETVAALQSGLASGDLDALRVASHSLKGNAQDFGATRLGTLCAELEILCKSDGPFDATPLVTDIQAETDAAILAMTELEVSDLA